MNWRRVIQLTMVHVGVSITVVPVTSTLNRIMIADMGLSALLAGALVALPYLLSPLQVTMGAWSDQHALWGRYRSPWILIGGLMASFGGYLTAHAVYLLPQNFGLGLVASLASFALWGVGVNVASVSYLSLLNELSSERDGWRSRAVSIMWTVMILSTIATSLALSRLLDPFSVNALYMALGAVWLVSSVLILFGAAGLEPARRQLSLPDVPQHSATPVNAAWRVVVGNRSARRFFVYLLLVLVSIHAQDVLLEPFGADALGMTVSQTSRLTALWGIGVLVMLLLGIPLTRRLGKRAAANGGAVIAAVAFLLIGATGLLGAADLFRGAIVLLGLGGGLMTVSNLSLMLDMTVPSAAGLYIGAWGVANFAGQAVGNLASGALRDLLWLLTGSPLAGYVAVFTLEATGLLLAVWLLRRISVDDFQRDARIRLPDVVMAG